VRDANGRALSYVYYECEPGRRSAAKLLSEDEARRIASNIAKLPECCASLDSTPALYRRLGMSFLPLARSTTGPFDIL